MYAQIMVKVGHLCPAVMSLLIRLEGLSFEHTASILRCLPSRVERTAVQWGQLPLLTQNR